MDMTNRKEIILEGAKLSINVLGAKETLKRYDRFAKIGEISIWDYILVQQYVKNLNK